MSIPAPTPPPPPPPRPLRPRARWPFVLGSVVILLVVLVTASAFIKVPYYALVPGEAISVQGLITLPPDKSHPAGGHLLLTDVGVNDVTLLGLIPAWTDSNTTLVSRGELTGNLPVSEFDAQGSVDMEESELTAKAVALRQLGYPVPEQDVGVTVYVIDPGSPAWRTLHVGDVITSVDGVATPNPSALQAAVRTHRPGDRVTMQIGSIEHPTPGHAVTIRLGSNVENGVTVPFVGIGDPKTPIPGMGTQPSYQFPFPVNINSDQIGGPSAGLAWTLGIVDKASGADPTGGRTVAATGTIHPDGTVGDVGGVQQKTVAVEHAGASVFLVPASEAGAARAKATRGLDVIGVSSVQQALGELQRLGGHLGSAANGPPPGDGGHKVPYAWQQSPWT